MGAGLAATQRDAVDFKTVVIYAIDHHHRGRSCLHNVFFALELPHLHVRTD